MSLAELRTILRTTAVEIVEEQAREYAVLELEAERDIEMAARLAAKIIDAIRRAVPDFGGEDRAACPSCGNLGFVLIGRRRRRILLDVSHERDKQEDKWKDQRRGIHEFLTILGEEIGEVNKAVLHTQHGGPEAGKARIELVQAAAVVVQILEQLDRGVLVIE